MRAIAFVRLHHEEGLQTQLHAAHGCVAGGRGLCAGLELGLCRGDSGGVRAVDGERMVSFSRFARALRHLLMVVGVASSARAFLAVVRAAHVGAHEVLAGMFDFVVQSFRGSREVVMVTLWHEGAGSRGAGARGQKVCNVIAATLVVQHPISCSCSDESMPRALSCW